MIVALVNINLILTVLCYFVLSSRSGSRTLGIKDTYYYYYYYYFKLLLLIYLYGDRTINSVCEHKSSINMHSDSVAILC